MRASELRKFSHFHILKLLFLSIFCWYFRYFVGTNLSAYMYRQISTCTDKTPKKALLGGGGRGIWGCPPPPSGYASDVSFSCSSVTVLISMHISLLSKTYDPKVCENFRQLLNWCICNVEKCYQLQLFYSSTCLNFENFVWMVLLLPWNCPNIKIGKIFGHKFKSSAETWTKYNYYYIYFALNSSKDLQDIDQSMPCARSFYQYNQEGIRL